ncbi:MerR family transcriptional regulator [Clostridium massiliamazoniense]|uniref:MerR family transcriptional regulator n=1 Tax=Clostridium massiliamazoniense TaxID=1347366 RepID=UPI0006D81B8C|nr:MerR family transcriptional regulator [Clostridium massiliamazoniense]
MTGKKDKLLKINDFAKLCGTNRKTLIYYDNIGLFSPILRDTNGYRYYSYQQYDNFSIILALKELNMPLCHIKDFIDNRSPELLIDTLKKQKDEIKKHIANLTKASSLIDSIINITETSKDIDVDKIYLVEEDEEHFILSKKINDDTEHSFLQIISDLLNYCTKKNINNNFNLGAILSKENLLKNDFSKIDYLFVKSPRKVSSKYSYTKPKGKYVIGYHIGDYKTTFLTYNKLLKFIDENNLKPCGNSYELELLNNLSYSDTNNYVTKISINVENK